MSNNEENLVKSGEPERTVIKTGIAYWLNLPSTIVWFEAGKDWAEGLFEGNWWERRLRMIVFDLFAPGYGTAMDFVIEFYRKKFKKYIGPNGIWIAVKVAPIEPPVSMLRNGTKLTR